MADHWLPWQRPLRNPKKLNLVNKPLHPSTNTEILVKNGLLGSELLGLESQPFKKNKENKEKNIGKIYSPSGKFAEQAKQQVYLQKDWSDNIPS